MTDLYQYQVTYNILETWENRCNPQKLADFLKGKSVDDLESILEFSENTLNSQCQLEEMIVWFYKVEEESKDNSLEILDYSASKEEKTDMKRFVQTAIPQFPQANSLNLNKTRQTTPLVNTEEQLHPSMVKKIVKSLGKPLYHKSLFEEFKDLIYESPITLSDFGKKYTSWRLAKKTGLGNSEEPRIKRFAFEEYSKLHGTLIDCGGKGPYRFDRLTVVELNEYKREGLIHRNFEYDHPFWFSKEPLPHIMRSLSDLSKEEYKKWNIGCEISLAVNSINSFDIEPRIWDGKKNRRLSYSELAAAKLAEKIDEDFKYDTMVWRRKNDLISWGYNRYS